VIYFDNFIFHKTAKINLNKNERRTTDSFEAYKL
jgi:hypothetical protein